MLQINNGSYKYKFCDADILLNTVHSYFWDVVICIEIFSSEVFYPIGSSPYTTLPYMRHINTQYSVLSAAAQLVEAPCYKPASCGFNSKWCH
jgi:hypothetical protein